MSRSGSLLKIKKIVLRSNRGVGARPRSPPPPRSRHWSKPYFVRSTYPVSRAFFIIVIAGTFEVIVDVRSHVQARLIDTNLNRKITINRRGSIGTEIRATYQVWTARCSILYQAVRQRIARRPVKRNRNKIKIFFFLIKNVYKHRANKLL